MREIVALLFSSLIVLASCSDDSKIHQQMTSEEVRNTFNTDQENVPEYEIVSVAHGVHENSPEDSPHRILQMKSFNQSIRLYLEPTEGILAGKDTPVWTVKGDPKSPLGVKYTRIRNAMGGVSHFYQDHINFAAFTITYDKLGKLLFDGTIGDNLVVRPLPGRLRKEFSRNKRDINEGEFLQSARNVYHHNLENTYRHVVFKKKGTPIDGMREKIGSYILKEKQSRSKRSTAGDSQVPKTVYPQVLVIVDYNEYLSLKTLPEIRRYVISFWNAVDLRYRVFDDPQVRLNIAGIIIATDPNGTPYIQNHRSKPLEGPILDADRSLDHLAEYFFHETMEESLQRFVLEKEFDVVMAMTQLNLCSLEPNDNDYDCTTLGYAFRGGACTVNMDNKMIESVGIVEDNGGYIGIVPAAHELGHLLGAPHDGHTDEDKTTCPAYGGYIMTGMLMLTENVFKWSYCSMEYFQEFFNSPRAECLVDMPKKSKPLRRILPGKILSLDEQCDRIRGTYACNKDDSVCAHLDCFVPDSGDQCIPVAPAAEGSFCGQGHYCLNGKCVMKNTTEVLLEFAPPPKSEQPVFDKNSGGIILERN